MTLTFTLEEAIAALPGKTYAELDELWKTNLAALRSQPGQAFTQEQREGLAQFGLVVPPEKVAALEQAQGDAAIRLSPVPLADGTLVLMADSLSDTRPGETFAALRSLLATFKIRHIPPEDWPQPPELP